MARIDKNLSTKAGPDGKHQIMLFIFINRDIRFRLKTPININPEYFDKSKGEISIPKKSKLYPDIAEDALKTRVELDTYINRIQTILCADRPKQATSSNDWKEWLQFILNLQDDEEINLSKDTITAKDIAAAIEAKELLEARKEAERLAKIEAEEAMKKEKERLTVVQAINMYAVHHKLSITRVKALGVIGRMMSRYIYYIRATENKNFELYADNVTSENIDNFRHYIVAEASLADNHKRIFSKIMEKFPISQSTKTKRKLCNRGENYVIDILKRLNAVFNWLYNIGKIDNQPFRNIVIGSSVYGTPIYITKAERNLIASTDLSNESEMLQTQRDIFIFQCLTGCRVCDLMVLTSNNINDGILEYVPLKTKDNPNQVYPRIPLNKQAIELIDKYKDVDDKGRLFPFISAQKYNEYIKLIFTACKIDRTVSVRNPTTGQIEIKPIGEVATSHMARRTFVGNAYKGVKDPNLICAMSGHVPGSKAFARYRTIDDEDLREVINKI